MYIIVQKNPRIYIHSTRLLAPLVNNLAVWNPKKRFPRIGHFLVKKSKLGKEGSLMPKQTRQIETGQSGQSSSP